MDLALATDWFNLLSRWFHITAGITWIGTSFYFMSLDFLTIAFCTQIRRIDDPFNLF